jgi:hypothetical protein
VDAPGFRTAWHTPVAQEGASAGVIRLVPGGSIVGTVTRPEGSPVTGARVVAMLGQERGDPLAQVDALEVPASYRAAVYLGRDERRSFAEDAYAALVVETDEGGKYRIDGVGLEESYDLQAGRTDWGDSEVRRAVRVSDPQVPARADLRLRESCRVVVRCVDSEGKPWPRLAVSLQNPRVREGETDAEGVARFLVTPGTYSVRVFPDEVRGGQWNPEVTATGGEVEIRIDLPGTPQHPAGDPYASPASAARASAPASANHQVSLSARVGVGAGVVPPPWFLATGTTSNGSTGSRHEWRPQADGFVLVEWTIEWTKYRFEIEAPDFLPLARQVDRAPDAKADLGVLLLDPGLAIAGVVVAPDGERLGGASVDVQAPAGKKPPPWEDEGIRTLEATTNADGTFRVGGLARGTVTVRVSDSRCVPFQMDVAVPSTEPARLSVKRGGVLRIEAVGAAGRPATRCHVTVRAGGDADSEVDGYGETDSAGRFEVRLGAGPHSVGVSSSDRGDATIGRVLAHMEEGRDQILQVVVPGR